MPTETEQLPATKTLSPHQLRDEERAADARDTRALVKLFRVVLADGAKADCRKAARVRALKPKRAGAHS